MRGDKLIYVRGLSSEMELKPIARDRSLMEGSEVFVHFESTADRVTALCFETSDDTSSATRREALSEDDRELRGFAGSYVSHELGGVVYQIESKGTELIVKTPDDELVFQQAFADFFSESRMGFLGIEWQRGREGRPSGFLVHAGRVRDIHFERDTGKAP